MTLGLERSASSRGRVAPPLKRVRTFGWPLLRRFSKGRRVWVFFRLCALQLTGSTRINPCLRFADWIDCDSKIKTPRVKPTRGVPELISLLVVRAIRLSNAAYGRIGNVPFK